MRSCIRASHAASHCQHTGRPLRRTTSCTPDVDALGQTTWRCGRVRVYSSSSLSDWVGLGSDLAGRLSLTALICLSSAHRRCFLDVQAMGNSISQVQLPCSASPGVVKVSETPMKLLLARPSMHLQRLLTCWHTFVCAAHAA